MYDFDFDKFPPPPIYDIIPIDVIMKNAQESQNKVVLQTTLGTIRKRIHHAKDNKKDDEKIVVWLPYLKTTMLIKESDFNPEWMEMPLKRIEF